MRTVLLLAAFLAVAPPVSAQPERPWALDDATRVARRFSPTLAAERAAASESCRTYGCVGRIVVEGKRNPELLMPGELMDEIPFAYHPDPIWLEHHRNAWSSLSGLASSPTFWDQLYESAKEFIDTGRNIASLRARWGAAHEVDRPAIEQQIAELDRTMCWKRADALASARLVFGRCSFDRFLYEAIAPGKTVGSSGETAETTLWVERGCW